MALHVGRQLSILRRGDGEYSLSRSLRRSSNHCLITCSSSGYFKIVRTYDYAWEIEIVKSHSLLVSSFPDSRTERLPYWDLSQVAKKNLRWAGCDEICDYRRWELDSPLRSSHKTGKHALEISIVSIKEESLSGEIDEYAYAHSVLWCTRSSLSAYCPLLYKINVLYFCEVLRTLKRHVNRRGLIRKNLAFAP